MAWPELIFVFVLPDKGELPEPEVKLFVSLMQERRWVEAVKFYEAVLERHPDYPPVLNALANVAYENRDYDTSFSLLGGLVKKFPENPLWMNNFAVVLIAQGELVAARGALQQALRASAGKSEVLYNLGCLSVCEGELPAALRIFRQLVAADPENLRAHFALSRIAKESGLVNEAILSCRRLVELAPEEAEFRQNLGFVLLKNGEWGEGLELYEARWQANRLTMLSADLLWQGEDLSGKTILVWDEQGLGDTINFARYLPLLLERKGTVVVAVQEVLVGLLACSFPELKVVGRRERGALAYDFQVPFLSLPRLFQAKFDSVPATVPYIGFAEKFKDKWQVRLIDDSWLRVGVVWAGNPHHANDAKRSIPLEVFAQLFAVAGVRFYSLQKEHVAGDSEFIDDLPSTISERFVDLADDLDGFQDTAAILENLDLLISVDTSVAHLAGALACPTWLLLPFDADWRWLLEREDSPWYPTMQLFRQPQPGAWQSVLESVRERLRTVVSSRGGL